MPTLSTILVFLAAGLALLLVPGPAVLYVVTRSIHQGRRAGIVSAAGTSTGSLVHITAAALGISALLVSSALAFSVVKYAGAAYLIFLGVRTMLSKGEGEATAAIAPRSLTAIYRQGVVVNTLNPKTALFFFAFLPQFIDPDRGSAAVQILILGFLFMCLGFCSDSLYAITAGSIGGWIKRDRRFLQRQRFVIGSIYIGLGCTTAFVSSERRS